MSDDILDVLDETEVFCRKGARLDSQLSRELAISHETLRAKLLQVEKERDALAARIRALEEEVERAIDYCLCNPLEEIDDDGEPIKRIECLDCHRRKQLLNPEWVRE